MTKNRYVLSSDSSLMSVRYLAEWMSERMRTNERERSNERFVEFDEWLNETRRMQCFAASVRAKEIYGRDVEHEDAYGRF